MPSALMMFKLQGALTPEAIATLRRDAPDVLEQLKVPGNLVEVAGNVLDLDSNDIAYLEAIPPALREGLRAAISAAIEAEKPVHVGFSPGYDFEVRIWDYEQGVSVHLSGPYPPTIPHDRFASP
jgi:hypothetical protein